MRLTTVVLYILSFAGAHPSTFQDGLEKRQSDPTSNPAGAESLNPVKSVETNSDIRPGAKRVVVSYGPFKIPPSKVRWPIYQNAYSHRNRLEPQ